MPDENENAGPISDAHQSRDEEDDALSAGLAVVMPASVIDEDVAKESRKILGEEAHPFHESLVLLAAAAQLAPSGQIDDPKQLAVLALLALQRELLWDGWKSLLEGRYAAAMHHIRLLQELLDFIRAAAISEDGAKLLLSESEWRVGDARRELAASGKKAYFDSRPGGRGNGTMQRFAHATNLLLMGAMRPYPDRIDILVAPGLLEEALRQTAGIYLGLAALSLAAVRSAFALAFGELIREDGPWVRRALAVAESQIGLLPAQSANFEGTNEIDRTAESGAQ